MLNEFIIYYTTKKTLMKNIKSPKFREKFLTRCCRWFRNSSGLCRGWSAICRLYCWPRLPTWAWCLSWRRSNRNRWQAWRHTQCGCTSTRSPQPCRNSWPVVWNKIVINTENKIWIYFWKIYSEYSINERLLIE